MSAGTECGFTYFWWLCPLFKAFSTVNGLSINSTPHVTLISAQFCVICFRSCNDSHFMDGLNSSSLFCGNNGNRTPVQMALELCVLCLKCLKVFATWLIRWWHYALCSSLTARFTVAVQTQWLCLDACMRQAPSVCTFLHNSELDFQFCICTSFPPHDLH